MSAEQRQWKVWVAAGGYAVVAGATKKAAVENARAGNFLRTPRPDWDAQISHLVEIISLEAANEFLDREFVP